MTSKSRESLQTLFETLLGSRNVYFQPPESLKINYPAIIYSLSDMDNIKADNVLYLKKNMYKVVVVDKNPESEIAEKIRSLDYCYFSSFYTTNNLNHFAFSLYF